MAVASAYNVSGVEGCALSRKKRVPDGALESAVMDVLWSSGGWMTTGEILDGLGTGRPLAYNTVTTIVARLFDKGRLERQRDGRAFAYRPCQSREEYTAMRMTEVLRGTEDRSVALARFVETLDPSDQIQLRRLLARLRQDD